MQGAVLEYLGWHKKALALLWESEKTFSETGNRDWLQRCFGYQARVHRHLGDTHFAMGLLKRMEWICREITNYDDLIRSLEWQAEIYEQMGQPERAAAARKEQVTIREHPENSGRFMTFDSPGKPTEED